MDELLTFFSESNITLSKEQTVMVNRLTENLRNVAKLHPDKNDELIMRSHEQEELIRFVSSVFHTQKKVMSQFVWRTLVLGVIRGARRGREY